MHEFIMQTCLGIGTRRLVRVSPLNLVGSDELFSHCYSLRSRRNLDHSEQESVEAENDEHWV